jgi:hypothetical protein
MKLNSTYIFLGIILLSTFSCSNSNEKQVTDLEEKKQVTDLEKENLKGDVVLVFYEVSKFQYINLYNENGMESRRIMGEKEMYYQDLNNYYEENKIIKSIIKNVNTNEQSEESSIYNYDNKGVLINCYRFTDNLIHSNTTYQYDLKGNLINEKDSSSFLSETKYFYGNKIDSIHRFFDNFITVEYYNDFGKVYKSISSKSNKLNYLNDFNYNENNDVLELITTDYTSNPNNPSITKTTYEYIYDKNENWIQQRILNSDGETEISNRTIIYKGEDISSFIKKSDEIISSIKNKTTNENNTESSNNNSQTESNENSSSNTYQQPERQQQQPQRQQQPEKIKCNSCNGSGKCPKCGKSQQDGYYSGGRYIRINEIRMGMVICTHCHGYGIFMEETGSECGWCKGQGWEFCRVCNYYGRGNNIGQCQSCKGSGYRN